MAVRVKAHAKLNLTLSVTGKEGGYHLIDSLACMTDLCDSVVAKKRNDGRVRVEMHGLGSEYIPPEENNAVKAAELYTRTFGTGGADITVYKNIPMGGGLGGSSADAAGVMRAMAMLYGAGSESRLKALCDELGSDAGYMFTGGFARIGGRGEKVRALSCAAKLYFLLLMPGEGVSTAKCYARYDLAPVSFARTEEAVRALLSGDIRALGKALGNDLYPAASALNPQVAMAVEELSAFSPLGVSMTGSGSGVFALFETPEMCAWAKSRYRGKFTPMCLKSV